MKKLLLASVAFVFINLISAQTVNENYVDGKIYFQLKNDVVVLSSIKEDPRNLDLGTISFIKNLERGYGIKKLSRPFFAAKESQILQRTYLLEFSNIQKADELVQLIQRNSSVVYAEKAVMRKISVTPNDPAYAAQWELAQINASTAWNSSTGSPAITVAIIDDAVELTHPDLSAAIWNNTGEIANNGIDDDNNGYIDDKNGYDVGDNDKDPNPTTNAYFHGTHVAGCAAAKSNNGIGVASIGYNVKIIAVKSSSTPIGLTNAFDGIVYAAVVKARIINMSFGGATFSTTEQNIIDYAWSRGCIMVGAAGNDNSSALHYPGALNHVICVGSTSSNDSKSSFSNYGSWVDVCAPGDNIYSTDISASYGYMSGTSFSSPIVAGLCALMLSKNPDMTQTDVENCVKTTATNINAVNGSYIGQLGTGRIDANAAMTCASATLLLKPTTNFYANFTTVTAGGKVTFTDSTIHTPTGWSWAFAGGTPSTANTKIPPQITYNTPGTYQVALTTSNGNGSDTKTRVGYIVVTSGGGCTVVNFNYINPTLIWTGTIYGAGATSPYTQNGFIMGKNDQDGGSEVAQYFDMSTSPYTKLDRVYIQAAYAKSSSKVLTFNVYDGSSGSPGALLGSTTKTMANWHAAISANKYLDVPFSTSITLPVSKKVFIGVNYSTLSWNGTTKDSLGIVSNQSGQTTPSAVWVYRNSAWGQFGTAAGYWNGLNVSMYMFPFITDQPPVATFTSSAITVCEGSTVSFDATGSTYQDTLLWYLPGSTNTLISAVKPSTIYNNSGTYIAKLYVVGGGCSELDSSETTITVNPKPTISIGSSGGTTICPGNSLTLTATGGSSFTWSPGTSLNTTSGAVVVASPTSNITYNVSGTQGSCSGSAAISIIVQQPVAVSVTTTPTNTTFCKNNSVVFNASGSTNVSNYTWSFPGGTPSSSTSASPTINYATPGTYTATLTASNTCSSNNSYSKVVTVNNCTGVEELFSSDNMNAFYNPADGKCHLNIINGFNSAEQLTLRMFNHLGQVILADEFKMSGTDLHRSFDMSQLAKGVYTVQLSGANGSYNRKLLVE